MFKKFPLLRDTIFCCSIFFATSGNNVVSLFFYHDRIIASLFLDIDMILEIGSCRNLEHFVSFQYYTSRVSALRQSNHSVLVRFHSKSEDFEFVLIVKKKEICFFGQNWLDNG